MGSLKDGSECCNLPSRQIKQTDCVPTIALEFIFKVNLCFYQRFLRKVPVFIHHPLT